MSVDPRTPTPNSSPSSTVAARSAETLSRQRRQIAVAASFAAVLFVSAVMPTSASGQSDDSNNSLTPVGEITLGEGSFAGAEAATDATPSIAASPSDGASGDITRVEDTADASTPIDGAAATSDLMTTATVEGDTSSDGSDGEIDGDAASDADGAAGAVASDTDVDVESAADTDSDATPATASEADTDTGTDAATESGTDAATGTSAEATTSAVETADTTETADAADAATDETASETADQEPAAQENETGDADDGEVGVPDIIFPVVGPVTYTDTWGACRGSGCSRSHKGVDVFGAKLAPLVAAADGVITSERRSGIGISGNMVIVTSDDGWRYLYIHLNNDSPGTDDGANPQAWIIPNNLRSGDRVKAGDVIGYLGDSGNAETTPAHLHFEIHQPGVGAINPTEAVQKAEQAGRVVHTSTLASTAENRAEHEPVVAAWYRALLKREPTSVELFAWSDRFAIGFATLDDLIADITMSKSRRDPSGAVLRSFDVALDRRPTLNELRAWEDEYRSGSTLAEITGALIASEPFKSAHGDLSDEEFVRVIYRNAVSTDPTDERLAEWLAVFAEGGERSELTAFWADSYSVKNSTWHELEVIQAFRATLDRLPTDAEYELWVDHLDEGGLITEVVTGIRLE